MQPQQYVEHNKSANPTQSPRYRITRKSEAKKAKSVLTLSEAAASAEAGATQHPSLDVGKRLLRWFRRGPLKRTANPSDHSVKPSNLDLVPNKPKDERGNFIGNLGLGQYIGAEDGAYMNHETNEEPYVLGTPKGISKSYIDLSSIQLLPDPPCVVLPQTDHQQPSINNDKKSKPCPLEDQRFSHIPLIIRAVFMSNYGVCVPGIVPAADQKVNDEEGYGEFELPAWLITDGDQLLLDTPYLVYKTRDYLTELIDAIKWLEDLWLHLTTKKTSYVGYIPRIKWSFSRTKSTAKADKGLDVGSGSSDGRVGSVSHLCDRCSWVTTREDCIQTLLNRMYESREQLHNGCTATADGASHASGESPAPQSAYVMLQAGADTKYPGPTALLPNKLQMSSRSFSKKCDYRKVLGEHQSVVYKVPHSSNSGSENLADNLPTKYCMLLTSDSLWLTQQSLSVKLGTLTTTTITFEGCLPLAYLWCQSLSVKAALRPYRHPHLVTDALSILLATTDPWDNRSLVSSSSGISTASLEEDIDDSQDVPGYQPFTEKYSLTELANRVASDIKGTELKALLLIGYPVTENWILQLANPTVCKEWKRLLKRSIASCQRIFRDRVVSVKLMNEAIENQVIYKSHNLKLLNTVSELKERGLASMNALTEQEVEIVVKYDAGFSEVEIPLKGNERPFLITFCVAHGLCEWISELVKIPSSTSQPRDRQLMDAVFKTHAAEAIMLRTSDNEPFIPSNQMNIRFILRPYEKPSSKLLHKPRRSPHQKRTDGSKQHSLLAKTQKGKRKVTGIAKSSIFLNTAATEGDDLPDETGPTTLRGAISMGVLNSATAHRWEIFGKLPQEVWPKAQISQSLMSLFVIIYYKGDQTEFIFRKSVKTSQIEKMRCRVDANLQLITVKECPPLLAGCVLKKYFSEIPNHLLNDSNWPLWCGVLDIPTDHEKHDSILNLIGQLPKVNQTLLALLLYVLARVRDSEETTKMSVRSLAVIWGPNLLQRPGHPLTPEISEISSQLAECLLDPVLTSKLTWSPELPRQFDAHWRIVSVDNSPNHTDGRSHSNTSVAVPIVASNFQKSDDLPSQGSSLEDRSDLSSTDERLRILGTSSSSSISKTSPNESHSASPQLMSTGGTNSPRLSGGRGMWNSHSNLALAGARNRVIHVANNPPSDLSPQTSLEGIIDGSAQSPRIYRHRTSNVRSLQPEADSSTLKSIRDIEDKAILTSYSQIAGDNRPSSRVTVQMPVTRQLPQNGPPPSLPLKGTPRLLRSSPMRFIGSETVISKPIEFASRLTPTLTYNPTHYMDAKPYYLPRRQPTTDVGYRNQGFDKSQLDSQFGTPQTVVAKSPRRRIQSKITLGPQADISSAIQARDNTHYSQTSIVTLPVPLCRERRFQSVDKITGQRGYYELPVYEYPYGKVETVCHQHAKANLEYKLVETVPVTTIQTDDHRRRRHKQSTQTDRFTLQGSGNLPNFQLPDHRRKRATYDLTHMRHPPFEVTAYSPGTSVDVPRTRDCQSLEQLDIEFNPKGRLSVPKSLENLDLPSNQSENITVTTDGDKWKAPSNTVVRRMSSHASTVSSESNTIVALSSDVD